jgi:hypothetical protein
MSLARFFEVMTPFLAGTCTSSETAQALGPQVDESRLALYGHFCTVHRHETLDGIYPLSRSMTVHGRWTALVNTYFVAHPPRHWELNANGEMFAQFLMTQPDLPPWLAELADFEWWQWKVFTALDHKVPRGAPETLSPLAILRPYAHDIVAFARSQPRPASPARIPSVAMLWRDALRHDHARNVMPVELVVIKALVERVPLKRAAEQSAIPWDELAATRQFLVKDGIIVPVRKIPPR